MKEVRKWMYRWRRNNRRRGGGEEEIKRARGEASEKTTGKRGRKKRPIGGKK